MAIALILAAGSGERLAAGRPKALVQLLGRPMLEWSLDALRQLPSLQEIVVALPPGVGAPAGTSGVVGGPVRSDSVRRALAAAGPGDPVLVHDAARPLLSAQLAASVLEAAQQPGVDGAVAARRVTDTIKRAREDRSVIETLDRRSLWAVQTPQVFRRAALVGALDVREEVLAEATDDAWLVERAGGRVVVVDAPAENLKITTALDLALAELLLQRLRPQPA